MSSNIFPQAQYDQRSVNVIKLRKIAPHTFSTKFIVSEAEALEITTRDVS